MNTKAIAKHYDQLTPEERFRLIIAASDRGDEAEKERLTNAAKRIQLSMPDHAPLAQAFQEVLFMTYIDLLDDAASYLESYALMRKQLDESIQSHRTRKRSKKATPTSKGQTRENDAVEFPDWHRTGRTAYAQGFQFKAKIQGWMIFCARINASPVILWEKMDLPGLDRLRRALALAHEGAAFTSSAAMVEWMNEVRPTGEPECMDTNIFTAERFANSLEATFRERVCWWDA